MHDRGFRGQMQPFSEGDLKIIRTRLERAGEVRDLALLNTGIDTMLRVSDLVRVKVSSVHLHTGQIADQFAVKQKKTCDVVHLGLTERTRKAIQALIEAQGSCATDYLFAGRKGPRTHLNEVTLRLLVKKWADIAGLDPSNYSGHSLRRTKAVFVYRATNNPEAVRQMLGHASLAHTVAYLAVTGADVSAMSRKFDI
jgi:integrase